MRNPLLVLFAIVEFLFPRKLIAASERVAFRNAEDATLRGWVPIAARVEGVAFSWLMLRGGTGKMTTSSRAFFGMLGLPAALLPERFVNLALKSAYSNGGDIEVRSWVVTMARLMGIFYLLVAIGLFPRKEADEEIED